MRVFRREVFNDYVMGVGTNAFTSCAFDALLASADELSLQVVVDDVDTAGRLFVAIEHSSDGRNWSALNTLNEVTLTTSTGTAAAGFGGSGTTNVLGRFARLRVWTAVCARAHVRVWAVGRDDGNGTKLEPRVASSGGGRLAMNGVRYMSAAVAARLNGASPSSTGAGGCGCGGRAGSRDGGVGTTPTFDPNRPTAGAVPPAPSPSLKKGWVGSSKVRVLGIPGNAPSHCIGACANCTAVAAAAYDQALYAGQCDTWEDKESCGYWNWCIRGPALAQHAAFTNCALLTPNCNCSPKGLAAIPPCKPDCGC